MGSLHKLVKGQGSQALTPQKLGKGPPRYKHSAGAIRPDKRGRPFGEYLSKGLLTKAPTTSILYSWARFAVFRFMSTSTGKNFLNCIPGNASLLYTL